MKVKEELERVLHELGVVLGIGVLEHIDDLLKAGEEKVAFEELCSYLYERNAALTDRQFQVPSSTWRAPRG
jgi:hypothetical protein